MRDPASVTVTLPCRTWDEIRGLSLGARAERVADPFEIHDVVARMLGKLADVGRVVAVFRLRPVAFSISTTALRLDRTGRAVNRALA